MKIRIILGHLSESISGEDRELAFARKLQAAGHDVLIYRGYYRADGTRPAVQHGGLFVLFAADALAADTKKIPSSALCAQLRDDQPDLLFIKGLDYALVKGAVSAVPDDVPVVAIIGGTPYEPDPIISRIDYVLEEFDGQTRPFAEHFTRLRGTLTLPKYINWDLISQATSGEQAYDIVNVGAFEERRKNQELLLPLADDCRLCMIGDGSRLDAFRTLADGSTHPVTFTGWIPPMEVLRHVGRSRLMVHTSKWEGFPRAIAEGLAMGVPVVAHRAAFPHMPSPAWGTLHDTWDMLPVIRGILANEERRAELGALAAQYARRVYSHDRLFSVLEEALTTVI